MPSFRACSTCHLRSFLILPPGLPLPCTQEWVHLEVRLITLKRFALMHLLNGWSFSQFRLSKMGAYSAHQYTLLWHANTAAGQRSVLAIPSTGALNPCHGRDQARLRVYVCWADLPYALVLRSETGFDRELARLQDRSAGGMGPNTGPNRASDSLTGDRSDIPEQAWHRATPRSGRLSGIIKRVNRYEPHVMQIDSSAWCSRSCLTSPGPRRTADIGRRP